MPLSGHDDVGLFNDVANCADLNLIIEYYVIIACLKRETRVKLINRIPGARLLISSLPGKALRTLVDSASVLKALPGKLDIKRHSPSILYISENLLMSTSVLKALPGKLDIKRHSLCTLYFCIVLL